MTILVSVGFRAYHPEKMRRVLAGMRECLPDPAIYNGHDYTDCFRVDDEPIILNKRRDGTIELVLTCDRSDELSPL